MTIWANIKAVTQIVNSAMQGDLMVIYGFCRQGCVISEAWMLVDRVFPYER